MVRREIALVLIVILGLSFGASNMPIEVSRLEEVTDNRDVFDISYDIHAPFNITSNSDFETQGWPGNGSATNPYIIQNLNITSADSTCIWIMNTTSYFRIENCLFISPVFIFSSQLICPITLTNSSNGKVESNKFADCSTAISGFGLSNYSISDNELDVSEMGITVANSNSTTISHNWQGDEQCSYGIQIFHCMNCTISFNKFDNISTYGLEAVDVHDIRIVDNSFTATIDEYAFTWAGIEILGGELCTVERNAIFDFNYYGITMRGNDCIVQENNVTSCHIGIHISTDNCTVTGNRIIDGFRLIEMIQANDTRVYSNSLEGGSGYYETGIAIYGGHECSVYLNTISRIGDGIYLQGSSLMNISSNSVIDGRYGFAFGWYSATWEVNDGPFSDCNITGNNFSSGGVCPLIENCESWNFETIRFEDNTVNGGLIGLFADQSQYTIDGDSYSQLLLVNCSEVTIDGGNFNGIKSDVYTPYYDPGAASAIYLVNCTACDLDEIVCSNNTIGIMIQDSTGCSLTGIEGQDNTWIAINIEDSKEIDLTDINLGNNRGGIRMSWSYGCHIEHGQIQENDEGIVLSTCFSTAIAHNNIHHNNDSILLVDSDGSEILSNTIFMNDRGILMNSTSECLITQNIVANNTGVGISLDGTSYRNDIFNNTFAYNTPNALCEGTSNHWDDQVDTGNWWSDYNGEGAYIIDENDQDHFPLNEKTTTTNETLTSETTTTNRTTGQWNVDPLLLGSIAGIGCIIILVYVIIQRRRVVVVE